jgi:redox-sensitive bicupin YhaK (pirin superfamily)
MGHQQALGPNEIQRMSAGTGVRHSEFNASKSDRLHFLQIWIEPATAGTKPSYEQIRFDPEEKNNKLKLLAGPMSTNGASRVNQDAHVFVAELAKGAEIPYRLAPNRAAWVQVVRGQVAVKGVPLHTGDGAAVGGEEHLVLTGGDAESSEFLLFDLT